jgi:hypothetical protein
MFRAYFVRTDNILVWICEMLLVFVMLLGLLYETLKDFFPFQIKPTCQVCIAN